MAWYRCSFCGIANSIDSSADSVKTVCKYCGKETVLIRMALKGNKSKGLEENNGIFIKN